MVQPKRRILICILALAVVLGAAGCAASAAGQPEGGTKSAGKPVAGDHNEIFDYLKAARKDLELIDAILTDKDLGLLEEETDSEEELDVRQLEEYGKILSGYSDHIGTVRSDIDKRTVPDFRDALNCHAAEKEVFKTLESILQEYGQTVSYAGVVLQAVEDLNALGNIQETTDLQAIYDAVSAGLGSAITTLEGASVPSFLESFNKDFINAFKQLDDAVFYMLSAIAYDDPVRMDAAEYLIGIMERNIENISLNWEQDLEDRQKMLMEDALAVQKTCDGLKSWLDTNINNLGGK